MPSVTRKPKPGYSLAERNPEIVRYWDQATNGDLTPSDIGARSPHAAWWRCLRDPEHQWQESIQCMTTRKADDKCPHCAHERLVIELTAGPEGPIGPHLAAFGLTFGQDNLVDESHASAHPQFVWNLRCEAGHEFRASLRRLQNGFSCPDCQTRRYWENKVAQKARYGGVFSLDKPRTRSMEDRRLAAELAVVFPVDFEHDAIRTRGFVGTQPFVTPDVLIPSLSVAIEWDGMRHRLDPSIDVAKEEALLSVGWHTIRASARSSEDHDNVIAAPHGPTLQVVYGIMRRLLTFDPSFSATVEQWHQAGHWLGRGNAATLIEAMPAEHPRRYGRPPTPRT